jgi:hypothetical protein
VPATERDLAGRLGPPVVFVAAALVVVWQNSRVAVLWDISYVLNTAQRIAGGQIPYRDFPLPHAPGTFLVQALLVRLLDGPFVVQIAYAALVSGLAAAATLAIVRRLLDASLRPAGWTALALSAPATVLGVYAVYPHPFYDPDCSAAMLGALLALLVCRERGWPPLRSVLAGALLATPLFFKQNTGGAFGVLACAALLVSALARRSTRAGEVWPLAGAVAGLTVMLALLHFTVGLRAVYRWTVSYPRDVRLADSPLSSALDLYRDPLALVALGAALGGAAVARWARPTRLARVLAVSLLLLPWLPLLASVLASFVPAVGLSILAGPPWLRTVVGPGLLGIWPAGLLLSLAAAMVRLVRTGPRFDVLLPFVLVGVSQAAFLSQGVAGSSYALWPVLLILLAASAAAIAEAIPDRGPRLVRIVLPVAGVVLAVAGALYVQSESRLRYAKVAERPIARARHPRLAGMATGGSYLPELDALLAFCEQEIPSGDPVLALPGEDPLYFALRRRPPLPVAQYDRTLNPFTLYELVEQIHERGVSWIIVKERLQIGAAPFPEQPLLLKALAPEFAELARVGSYRVLRRVSARRFD